MLRTSALVVATLAVALAGCGSEPKTVTKAQYEREVQRLGTELTNAGSELGRSIDIATFNGNVDKLQDTLHSAADDLHGMKPPANVQGANDQLADALDGFADELEQVKEARRKSIYRARDALVRVSKSQPVSQARRATRALKRAGYQTGQFGSL